MWREGSADGGEAEERGGLDVLDYVDEGREERGGRASSREVAFVFGKTSSVRARFGDETLGEEQGEPNESEMREREKD